MKNLIFIGHSHLASLKRAWESLAKKPENSNYQAYFFIIDHNNYYDIFSIDDGKAKLREKFIKQVHSIQKGSEHFDMVLSLAGNDHSIIGLAKAQHDYLVEDIASQHKPQTDGFSQILSRDLLKAVFEERLIGIKDLIPHIIEKFQLKPYLLESPPPLASEKRIKDYPGVFTEILEEYGVNHPDNRLSLWRIQNQVMRQYAATNEISFINNPQQIFDADGFLSENLSGGDPTHGNQQYGVEVLNQLRKLLEQTAASNSAATEKNHD